MGLFDDALKKVFSKAADVVSDDLKNSLKDTAAKIREAAGPQAEEAVSALKEGFSQAVNIIGKTEPQTVPAPSVSHDWYETVPAEENQYNYHGSWKEYFRHIFEEDFPDFRIFDEANRGGRGIVFWFVKDGAKKLAVEVISEKSSVYAFRQECRRSGMPYLRFYYDHKGWWNTRSYIDRRVREALGL